MNPSRLVRLVVSAGFSSLIASAGAQSASTADYVAIAKRVTVKSLDSSAADVPFERWLAELGHVNASAITWEVNDCGEGGDGHQAPTCVEAQFKLRGDSVASASLIVADLEGKRAPPRIWWLLIGDGTRFTEVKPFAAWVAAVQTMRGPGRIDVRTSRAR